MTLPVHFVIVGAGRWGSILEKFMMRTKRSYSSVSLSRDVLGFEERLRRELPRRLAACYKKNYVNVVWAATAPINQYHIADIAFFSGFDVILEKPWLLSEDQEGRLALAQVKAEKFISVNYQYCFLSILSRISDISCRGDGGVFKGSFRTPTTDRFGVGAMENLGSHFVAVYLKHFSSARLERIEAAYDSVVISRQIELSLPVFGARFIIDFLQKSEDILSKYIQDVEACLVNRTCPSIDLDMAVRVRKVVDSLREQQV